MGFEITHTKPVKGGIGMKKIKEFSVVFGVGSAGYSLIEILWRGYTHWTMALTGGICLTALYSMNFKLCKQKLWKKCLAGSALITIIEFSAGLLINKVFQLNVWDYSDRKFNLMGQICPLYSILWFLLCIPVNKLTSHLHSMLKNTSKNASKLPLQGIKALLRSTKE
jgi:uncharacterized membrane protein